MYLMTDFLVGYVVRAGAGAGPPLHVHDREDECFYVLDGELSIYVLDGELSIVRVVPG